MNPVKDILVKTQLEIVNIFVSFFITFRHIKPYFELKNNARKEIQ